VTAPAPRDPLGVAYRATKDFGFAVVVAAFLLWKDYRAGDADAAERRELRRAVEAQTVAMLALGGDVRATADVVRLGWPRVRLPSPVKLAAARPGDAP